MICDLFYRLIDIFDRTDPTLYKQVIVVRTDLKMRRGKEISQGSHASMLSLINHRYDKRMRRWLRGPFTKITVSVDSEDALNALIAQAKERNIIVAPIIDSGRTEFKGQPTLTCAAFGPENRAIIDELTGHLKLR